MPSKELNKNPLNAVLNGWAIFAYLQGWDFEMKSYKATCNMFELIEVREKVYKGGTPSKIPIRVDVNRASNGRKLKRGEAALPTNPEKGRAGKRRTKKSGHPSNPLTLEKMLVVWPWTLYRRV